MSGRFLKLLYMKLFIIFLRLYCLNTVWPSSLYKLPYPFQPLLADIIQPKSLVTILGSVKEWTQIFQVSIYKYTAANSAQRAFPTPANLPGEWFVLCWCPETETGFFYWAYLSRFHLKAETESSLRNVVFLNKRQDDG
jgi:hypothetical protein